MKRHQIRKDAGCAASNESIYECLSGLTAEQVLSASLYTDRLLLQRWGPTADNDFFPADINNENYKPAQK